MMYAYTIYLHSIMAILSLGSLVYLFNKKANEKNTITRGYFYWFLFFLLYNISLILPLLYFKELMLSVGWFYGFAVLFLAIAAWNAFKVALDLVSTDNKKEILFSNLYLTGVILAVVLHFIFPEAPKASIDGKLVFWYSNQLVSYLFIFFMFVGGWQFAYSFFKGFIIISSRLSRMRSLFISIGSFTLPFAAFYYFGATKILHIYLAFLFSILGLIFLLIGNMLGILKNRDIRSTP